MGAANQAEFRAAIHDLRVVRSMLADYRAGLHVDRHDEEADRAAGVQVEPPVLMLWSLRDDLEDLYGDPVAVWRNWSADVRGHGIDSGHHLVEEAPASVAAAALIAFSGSRPHLHRRLRGAGRGPE